MRLPVISPVSRSLTLGGCSMRSTASAWAKASRLTDVPALTLPLSTSPVRSSSPPYAIFAMSMGRTAEFAAHCLEHKVVVRPFQADGVRVTVSNRAENDSLLAAARAFRV